MNAPTDKDIPVNTQIREFIADIAPIFRGRQVFIADVGAHVGSTFAAFYRSSLKINRACLFEANPKNFAKLQALVSDLGAGDRATCLQLAVSDSAATVTLHDMNDMSRVIGTDEAAGGGDDGQVFEVKAQPLDDFRTLFPDGHVSILKVDVEGHELEVFRGAAGLLADHAVEVVYVEAGMDRDNPQQTHYREIEDLMHEHGYRLFKIYEQTMEWIDDRPLLRRMNMAFVSPVVAMKYPYSMLKELVRQDEVMAAKTAEIKGLREELAKAHQELATLARTVHELKRDPAGQSETGRALAAQLAESQKRVRALETSTSWRITAPLRKIVRGLKGS